MALKSRIRRRAKRRSAPKLRRSSGGRAQAQRSDAKAQMQAESPLMIGGAHDPAEKAADRMAAQVLGGQTATGTGASGSTGSTVQRKCAACAANAQEDQNKVSRKCAECANDQQDQNKIGREASPASTVASGSKSAPASPAAAKAINTMGSGRPMARSERAFFEPRFERDFSNVRVHDGAAADKAARKIGARAFAHGNDIAFAKGERDRGGKALMAHELAHVATEGHAARRAVRRLGDTSKIPRGMACPVPTSSPVLHDVSRIQFGLGGATLTPDARADLSTVAAGFHAMAGAIQLRVDGFASTDGSDEINWTLSCQRAEAVRAELQTPSDGSPGVPASSIELFAQGETSEFSRSRPANRVATVRSDIPFAPVSCQHGNAETRASACIQPVTVAEDDGSSPIPVPNLQEVTDIWARCCVDVAINPTVTVSGTRFKEIEDAGSGAAPTQEQRDLFAAGGETGCVEIYFVDTIRRGTDAGKHVAGGGTTKNSGTTDAKIFVVGGVVPSVVAHELAHAFNVHHNLGTRADGTDTVAKPTGAHDRPAQPNVSDPICTTARGNANVVASGGAPTCCKDLS
ncbi:MAG: DUF4157 domain-containing protein [Pseudomonadota bacterium]